MIAPVGLKTGISYIHNITNESLKETMNWDSKGKTFGASYNWHKDNPIFWEQFYAQIPYIRQLYFAGGESTVIEEHYDYPS